MTRLLRDSPRELRALVDASSQALSIPPAFVEKDFWATEVLRVVAHERQVVDAEGRNLPVNFVFKGGTSLSRVFGVTRRFSEDIDVLAVFPPKLSAQVRHRVFKEVDRDVASALGVVRGVVEKGQSTTGVKRNTRYFPRDRLTNSVLSDGVLLELGSRGGSHPSDLHLYRSLVSAVAVEHMGLIDTDWQEFAPFQVRVLAPERTLLEKLSALHSVASAGQTDQLAQKARHYYDVYCLLGDTQVRDKLASLGNRGIAELAEDIHAASLEAGFPSTPRPEGGFGFSTAFESSTTHAREIDRGYRAIRDLVFGDFPSLDDVCERVREYSHLI